MTETVQIPPNFAQFEAMVLNWADERGILAKANTEAQMLKTGSEFGELCDAVAERDLDGVRDGIGDVLVTLILQAHMQGLTVVECLAHAWDQIKDRKGKMVGGVFVKET